MNTKRAIVALLTVISVLLSLNLVAKGTGRAEAQSPPVGGEPYVAKWLPVSANSYLRVWSDGQADRWLRTGVDTCEFSSFPSFRSLGFP